MGSDNAGDWNHRIGLAAIMDQFKIVAHQEQELGEIERIRINMAYSFYCDHLKGDPDAAYGPLATLAVAKADMLLAALGYEDDNGTDANEG